MAADYYRAMAGVEERLALGEGQPAPTLDSGQLLALVDALCAGTLNDDQKETAQTLRSAILSLVG